MLARDIRGLIKIILLETRSERSDDKALSVRNECGGKERPSLRSCELQSTIMQSYRAAALSSSFLTVVMFALSCARSRINSIPSRIQHVIRSSSLNPKYFSTQRFDFATDLHNANLRMNIRAMQVHCKIPTAKTDQENPRRICARQCECGDDGLLVRRRQKGIIDCR